MIGQDAEHTALHAMGWVVEINRVKNYPVIKCQCDSAIDSNAFAVSHVDCTFNRHNRNSAATQVD